MEHSFAGLKQTLNDKLQKVEQHDDEIIQNFWKTHPPIAWRLETWLELEGESIYFRAEIGMSVMTDVHKWEVVSAHSDVAHLSYANTHSLERQAMLRAIALLPE